ncbi:uncharacterized protein JKF63_07947 [Porcisia hertigi]|uniref:C2 NT-type domain-containing protein n=1 Tax=Porcisia hertigi TaxID=2761500 RepID=A0A836GUI3_9TRYP|nr:hypothetical protein JKF63_07947 [Porcisia hertigi]
MPRETHVLRFKVISVECSSLPNGQQYTIMYHRGDTNRSTPCYAAQGGVINFATMPEGAAVVHFKSGRGNGRFAPKYIRFMLEEYTRGMPRRLVGETEVDCTQVLKGLSTSGSGLLTVVFRLYGTTAKMKTAVLVYPEHAVPLTFDGLIDPSEVAATPPPQTVKVMGRSEAMMVLMGLETLLERRRTMEAEGKTAPKSREEQKLAELEERRKALVGSEGLAKEVIQVRCEEIVAVQYIALARKHRNNFIGQTAAYLREMALSSGEDFMDDDVSSNNSTTLEQLNRVNRGIEVVQEQMKKLNEQQVSLGRIQEKVDVTAELCANLERVAALQQKMQLLQQSRTALVEAVKKLSAKRDTPLAQEVAAINARIAALNAEQQQMKPRIQHMSAVAAINVVKWARSKNPPVPDVTNIPDSLRVTDINGRNAVDDLFRDTGDPKRSNETTLDDVQRKQVVEALKGLKATAPPSATGSPTSMSSSSGHRTPRDLFADAGLPSAGDFSINKANEDGAAGNKASEKSAHKDPLKPSGLGIDMFSAQPAPAPTAAAKAGLPAVSDFTHSPLSSRERGAESIFNFGAILQASSASPQMGGGGFVLELQQPDAPTASPAVPATTGAYNKKDDPYYDEMDDFTVAPDAGENNTYGTVEITGGFLGFGDDMNAQQPAVAAASPLSGYVAPRPTFDFGAGAVDSSSTNTDRNGSNNPYSGISNLPTYNFGN